jgi:2-keto-4-pentenoate hydratase/2-oxohepta-3-ene-1,7-dioic acid hydratase in catechol pathway
MKIASFEINERATYGVLVNDALREPNDTFRAQYPDLRSVIAAGAQAELGDVIGDAEYPVEDVRFAPCIPNPDKVICIGVNFRPHIEEMGHDLPQYPVVFVRFAGSQTGHGCPVVRPAASEQFDYEGELGVVIGKRARHVSRESALDYVAGYCCFMDGSVRDWQYQGLQFTPGKNFDRSGSMGPCLVTADEIPDPSILRLTTRINGKVRQEGRISDLVFDVPALLEYCSTFTELLPGDVIATGTPGGVGAAAKPPQWLMAGDLVEVEIPGVGLLVNPVMDEGSL